MTGMGLDKKKIARAYIKRSKEYIKRLVNLHKQEVADLERFLEDGRESAFVSLFFCDFHLNGYKPVSDEDVDRALSEGMLPILKQFHYLSKSSDFCEKTAKEILDENGYDSSEIMTFENESYDSALIGVSNDNRAVYSYNRMVEWYMNHNNCSDEDAREWIDYNTLGAIPSAGAGAPIVVFEIDGE